VPASERSDLLPPNTSTQQYGAATWWRPAVTFNEVDGMYHAFWVYWEPGRGMYVTAPTLVLLVLICASLVAFTEVCSVGQGA
jgi:hypothetical protein